MHSISAGYDYVITDLIVSVCLKCCAIAEREKICCKLIIKISNGIEKGNFFNHHFLGFIIIEMKKRRKERRILLQTDNRKFKKN